MGIINYAQFAEMELKVGQILTVENIPGADRIYKLSVNLGETQTTLVAGIKPYYSKEELTGKKVAVIVNLEPRIIRGVESRGMVLAATSPEGQVVIITPEKDLAPGSIIK